jgi:tetratricopeptide (TPR) repeat protein
MALHGAGAILGVDTKTIWLYTRPVTVLSDLYSFGILFYELLTGYLPYPDVKSIFTSPPVDPMLINKTLPIELSHLILRCLEKKPEDRYKGWDDVINDLLLFYNRITSDQYIIKGGPEPLTHLDWIAKGASLFALGDYEEGQRCYDEALTLASTFPPAWYGKGLCLECLGQIEGAIQCFNAAIEVNPYLAEAFCGKARCLLRLQRFGEAVACYERAYEAQLLTSIGSD